MFNDITSRYNMTDATLEILIMLLVAFILGTLLGYLLGKRCCEKEHAEKQAAETETFTATPKAEINTPTETSVQTVEAAPVIKASTIQETGENTTQEEAGANTDTDDESSVKDDWKPSVLSAPLGEPDDLKRISGIGPVIEKTLNEFGFFHYQQIAELTEENVAWLDNYIAFPGRINRENWVGQAKDLLEGNETEFAKRYDKKS